MNKIISFLFLFLIILTACSSSKQAEQENQDTISTPIDSELSEADVAAEDFEDSDLGDIDSDLEAIENI